MVNLRLNNVKSLKRCCYKVFAKSYYRPGRHYRKKKASIFFFFAQLFGRNNVALFLSDLRAPSEGYRIFSPISNALVSSIMKVRAGYGVDLLTF